PQRITPAWYSHSMPGSPPRLQLVQIFNHFLHAAHHESESIVIELVGRVARRMIVRITKRRGVGDHDAGITVSPERPLIRPTDPGNKCGKRRAFGWNLCMLAKKRARATEQRA